MVLGDFVDCAWLALGLGLVVVGLAKALKSVYDGMEGGGCDAPPPAPIDLGVLAAGVKAE